MLFYRAALPLSSKTLNYAAGIIRRHRASIGSLWRKLNPGQQALLVLAYLRKGETFAELAAGFGVGTATAWRYVNETVELLAARAPKLRKAVRDAKKAGYAYVVLDGTLIAIDRVAADRPFYSGKHKRHGMNLQVIASPDRGHPVGLRRTARLGPRQESRVGLGRPGRARGRRADHAGRQGLPGNAPGRRSRTGERASRNRRKRPTAPTRSSAPPAKGQTPCSRTGGSSASSAAAPGAPGNSPRPSTPWRSTRA